MSLKATLGNVLQEDLIIKSINSGELTVRIDIPLKTVQIVGWKETSTSQGVSKRCSLWNKAVGMTPCSTLSNQECMDEKKQKVWFHD